MVKLIFLSDEVYNVLRSMKKYNESFSQLIKRKIKNEEKGSVLDLAGSIKDKSFDDAMKLVLSKREINRQKLKLV